MPKTASFRHYKSYRYNKIAQDSYSDSNNQALAQLLPGFSHPDLLHASLGSP